MNGNAAKEVPALYFWLVMVLLALAVSFAFQGTRGLYETSEGRYAESAREMIETGNYLEPTLGYRPHWTKPPMTYWAIAGGMRILGCNEWGARLFNSVALLATILALAYVAATLWGKAVGLTAGLIYASSPFPVLAANALTTDTLLTLWEVCAVLCYLRACHGSSPRERQKWMAAMWTFFGLGFLTKGPPALIPLIPVILWNFRYKGVPRFFPPVGIILFFLLGFSWYVVVCLRHPELVSYFLGVEVIDRVTSSGMHHSEWYQPFVQYLPVLTLGAGPWIYFGWRILWKRRLLSPGSLWSALRRESMGSFLLLWLLLPLILFFLVKSRLVLYVLPLYAPIALAIARGLWEGGQGVTTMRSILIVALLAGVALIGIKGVVSFYPNKNNTRQLYEACREVSGEGARFAVFNNPKLHGLQFYLNGHLRRVSPTGKEMWADGSIEDALREMKASESERSFVLISDEQHSSSLHRALKESGIPFRQVDKKHWILFVTGGK